MPTVCTDPKLSCQSPDGVRQPRIEADFSGGTITSNAGILLAGLAAQGMNLFDRLGACFRDHRRPDLTVHSCRSLAGQRGCSAFCSAARISATTRSCGRIRPRRLRSGAP